MIGWIIAGIAALALKGQLQGSTPASGPTTTVGVNPPALGGNLLSSAPAAPLSREGALTTWQAWQTGPFVPVPTGSSQDVLAPSTAQSDTKANQAAQLASYGGAPQVINPVTGLPQSGSIASSPAPAGTSGSSGTSGTIPGQGFGGGCPLVGTKVEALCGKMEIKELDETEWVEIVTENKFSLTASLSHLLYTDRGLIALDHLERYDKVITEKGESRIVSITPRKFVGKKMHIHVPDGHLYWAAGILSHNKPTVIF